MQQQTCASPEPTLTRQSFLIKGLGPCKIASPLSKRAGFPNATFVRDEDRLYYYGVTSARTAAGVTDDNEPTFELAGPREHIYYDPAKTRAAIVTCGGLCPGLNDVIRGLVLQLWRIYGVRRIYGFRYGYQGFIAKYNHDVVELTPDTVDGIQEDGGSILSCSRGNQDVGEIVDCLERMSINTLFVVGGDGTLRGGLEIAQEIEQRNLKIALIGIPKTIDNDISFIGESFGFSTAYSRAVSVLTAAHMESKGAPNGIGLVKLMGRDSGFIACHAALAMSDVNFVLIPEVPFKLDGENGFLNVLRRRLEARHHAVIVVAEGAGQDLIRKHAQERDASGNVRYGDIGIFLKDRISDYFKKKNIEINLKYIDPSYYIRSVPASPQDRIYCMRLAQNAAHAAMCGKTEMVVGCYHDHFVHIPIDLAIWRRKQVDPSGDLWRAVIESTQQPIQFE